MKKKIQYQENLPIENKFDFMITNVLTAAAAEREAALANESLEVDHTLTLMLEDQLIITRPSSINEFETKLRFVLTAIRAGVADTRIRMFCDEIFFDMGLLKELPKS